MKNHEARRERRNLVYAWRTMGTFDAEQSTHPAMTIRKMQNEAAVKINAKGAIRTLPKTVEAFASRLDGFVELTNAMNRGVGALFLDFKTEAQASDAAEELRNTVVL